MEAPIATFVTDIGEFARTADRVSAVRHASAAASDVRSQGLRSRSPHNADATGEHGGRIQMLHYAIVFFIIAIVAAILGFGGIAAGAAGIAKVLFFVFLVLAVLTFLRRA